MNDLDLPARRTLSPEARDRIRTRVNVETPRSRYKAPLSVAAAVAALVAGAVIIGPSTTGTQDGNRAGTPASYQTSATKPSDGATVPESAPVLSVIQPNTQTGEDLDHCWDAVQASPRASEFAPRSAWQPVFTVARSAPLATGGVLRVTAFRENGDKPGFCEISEVHGPGSSTSWSATVSDPSAAPIPLATGGGADIHAVYFSHGLMAGVAQGVDSAAFLMTTPFPDTGAPGLSMAEPVLQDGLFVVEVGGLSPATAVAGGHPDASSSVAVTGLDGNRNVVTSGEWTYDPAKDPLTGPSLVY
jgi:hypothetical protein